MNTAALVTMSSFRILLAEDDQELRGVLALALQSEGHTVTECCDGAALVEHLASHVLMRRGYDIVVSDIRMPGITGTDILKQMYDTTEFPPVILITAFGDETTHEEARRLGAAAVLDKPFGIRDLSAKIQEVVSVRSRSSQPSVLNDL